MTKILTLGAVVVVLILATIALTLHWRLYKLRAAEALAADKRSRQKQDINRSIQLIARALDAQQLGAVEASIRISVLMDALAVHEAIKSEFSVFYKLAEEASHIPILDAWKALSREQRAAFDMELLMLENKYQDFVQDAASRIQGREL